MEEAVRQGQYKRKCKELEDYSRQEGLPYKAVLSWFDRNKSRLMQQDAQPQMMQLGQAGPDGTIVPNPDGAMVPIQSTPTRFKPTPDQILGEIPPSLHPSPHLSSRIQHPTLSLIGGSWGGS